MFPGQSGEPVTRPNNCLKVSNIYIPTETFPVRLAGTGCNGVDTASAATALPLVGGVLHAFICPDEELTEAKCQITKEHSYLIYHY